MFDEELASLPGPGLILAGGDNVGASPPNSLLLEDMPAIDVENAWGLDATSYGNHEFDYGVERLLRQQARAHFPFLATNIVETATGELPDWVTPSVVQCERREGRRDRRRAEEHAGARLGGCNGRPHVPRRGAADQGRVGAAPEGRRQGADRRHPPGDEQRPQHDRQRRGRRLGRSDPRHRGRPRGHVRGRDGRRPHPPHLEPDAGQHPDHRGDQRRDELLRPPADDPRRRRRVGRRRDARRQDARCRPAGRRQGDRGRRRRPDGGPAQPGDRQGAERHHACPDATLRVGDGQHGDGRDAGEVPGRRRGLHQLGRTAPGHLLRPAERGRASG